jgi:type I protein arginine methyltransferase
MYSLHSYGQMLADTPRMQAYTDALRRVVTPGSVVLDLGCGPGVFALLACQLGARRVYAVEPDNVIELAREAAKANGFADRIEFVQKMSTEITLPEQADVIVSDLRGVLPWYRHHIPSIVDARKRMLAPNGTLLPCRDILWAAIVEAPDRYQEIVGPWKTHGFDLSAAARVVTNTWRKSRIEAHELLVNPSCWTTLEYREIESADVSAEISWQAERPGTAHGIAVWFDSVLMDDAYARIGFSNAPGAPELIYGCGLFPFPGPVTVAEGDRINVRLSADFVNGDYVWRWETDFPSMSFKQSTFFGVPLSPAQLRKRANTYAPVLNELGLITRFVLAQMDGRNSIEQIATKLSEQFAVDEALTFVAEISEKYSG